MEQRVLDASGIIGQVEGPFEVSYNSRDLLAYALGIGCSSEQSSEFRFLYEGSPGFAAFPTYPLVLPYKGLSSDVVPFPGELNQRRGLCAMHLYAVPTLLTGFKRMSCCSAVYIIYTSTS